MTNLLKDNTFRIAFILACLGIIIMLAGKFLLVNIAQTDGKKDIPARVHSDAGQVIHPERIVCVTPLGTELIYALGCQNYLVGVDDFSDYPAEVAQKKKIGSFFDTNFEAITALAPDLIITLGESKDISDYCRSNNIGMLKLRMADLSGIYDDIQRTGVILGCPDKAQGLCEKIFSELNGIRSELIRANNGENPACIKVFLCINRKSGTLTSLGTAGPGTCLTELIEIAGGKNIFDDLAMPYADISRESLLSRTPEVIIEAVSAESIARRGESLCQEWQSLDVPAVKNGRVYLIDENLLGRPGVRSGEIARRLFQLIQGK